MSIASAALDADALLRGSDVVCTQTEVARAVARVASEIEQALGHANPLVLAVANGAVMFAGQLLALLRFPLEFEIIRVSRYGNELSGGALHWLLAPQTPLSGRSVLVIDDILDQGWTLQAVRDKVLQAGARSFHSAVLVEKETGASKAISADFLGLKVPDRYVFGCGMDAKGYWRNLPEIRALRENIT